MKVFPLLALIFLLGCSKEEKWSEMDLYKKAVAVDPSIEIILPKDINSGVQCSDYPPGCIRGKQAKLRRVIMTVVEFENEKLATEAAFHIGQYHAKNWVFDDVAGEPVLEHFVQKAFSAEKANQLPVNSN